MQLGLQASDGVVAQVKRRVEVIDDLHRFGIDLWLLRRLLDLLRSLLSKQGRQFLFQPPYAGLSPFVGRKLGKLRLKVSLLLLRQDGPNLPLGRREFLNHGSLLLNEGAHLGQFASLRG